MNETKLDYKKICLRIFREYDKRCMSDDDDWRAFVKEMEEIRYIVLGKRIAK